jgi:sugar phosphate isomerase/epimerase
MPAKSHPPAFERIIEADKLVHEPARLAVLTALSACKAADFVFLQQLTGLQAGNLSQHLAKLAEARRAIPRMKKLGTRLVRIMSFAVLKDREPEDQMEQERFRRVRELYKMFTDAGLMPVHENCMNYGGMGWTYTLRLLENVLGLKLVFDTGNPVFTDDRTQPKPYPKQSAWEFYKHVKEHIAYIHIKDDIFDTQAQVAKFTFAGEGHGEVKRILTDLLHSGYDGGISIEPHLAVVFHDASITSDDQIRFNNYVEYGRRMEAMIREIQNKK